MSDPALVSAILPTYNRRRFLPRALQAFLGQDYPHKELIVLDDGEDPVADLIPDHPAIRYRRLPGRLSVGAKRNLACEEARGGIILHWDDDDWMAPWRITYQVSELERTGADLCGLDRLLFYDPAGDRAWRYVYEGRRPWVAGATMCYRKSFWRKGPFADLKVGEDNRFVARMPKPRVAVLADERFYVAMVHGANTSPKRTGGKRYRPLPSGEVKAVMGEDWRAFAEESGAIATPAREEKSPANPRAERVLVAAGGGLGDILRMTPLIRILHQQGCKVDLLLVPDFPGTADLLRGAPEIDRLQVVGAGPGGHAAATKVFADREYASTYANVWVRLHLRGLRANRSVTFDQRRWEREGDPGCLKALARELGWTGALPPPIAIPSARSFDIPPGTVALHPGCKTNWPWKKWHGFGELASLFPKVALVGLPSDLENGGTYFGHGFEWPPHAHDFMGRLDLPDTAALLSRCAAMVSNDSGLMHLAAALGIPTFGIFGLTSPGREAMPLPNMHPVTKGLPCEPACREKPWGRRDCEHHLRCLKTLEPEEVAHMVRIHLGEKSAVADEAPRPEPPRPVVAKPARDAGIPADRPSAGISLAYHGYVFDASGYGQAARAYIHALHAAGIDLTVVPLGGGGRAVEDPLVLSLLGRPADQRFQLFHGIPPQWSRQAFKLRNAIGMTVWETDSMPPQWRNALNHVLEVWLPCDFNVSVFRRSLEKPVFKLPHAIPPRLAPELLAHVGADADAFLGTAPGDTVFYSLFAWQERKSPRETLECFLRAFPDEQGACLVVKAEPSARAAAEALLAETRARHPSRAKVILRCENWSEVQVETLHARGDCYLSLHRGEGWGYPLFEAARRGKPVVATAYSGPLEYLDPAAHHLVGYSLEPVRQRYPWYNPAMRWARPDAAQAVSRLREVFASRSEAAAAAANAAGRLEREFSLAAVGQAARARLLALSERISPPRNGIPAPRPGGPAWKGEPRPKIGAPPIPIPASWYDGDYFDTGLKSNWKDGYHWPRFSGLFADTAACLKELFPGARTWLDMGCAKGFLVRALREAGHEAWGFDHSAYALEHAELQAAPYLTRASAEDFAAPRTYHMLTTFSLLESLTEAAALDLLRRSRPWAEQGLFAVIPGPEGEGTVRPKVSAPGSAKDGDLSHVTMRPEAWWRDLFLEAGWKQDPLHGALEAAARRHPLVVRMGWRVFLFSPG